MSEALLLSQKGEMGPEIRVARVFRGLIIFCPYFWIFRISRFPDLGLKGSQGPPEGLGEPYRLQGLGLKKMYKKIIYFRKKNVVRGAPPKIERRRKNLRYNCIPGP